MASPSARISALRNRYLFILCISFLPMISLMVLVFLTSFQPLFLNLEKIVEKSLNEIRPIHQLQISLVNAAMLPHDYLLHNSPNEIQNWEVVKKEVGQSFDRLIRTERLVLVRQELIDLQNAWDIVARSGDQLFRDLKAVPGDTALSQEVEEFDSRLIAITLGLNRLIDSLGTESLELYRQIHRLKTRGIVISLTAVLTGFLLGIAGTIWLTRDRKKMAARVLSDPLTGILNRLGMEKAMNRLHDDRRRPAGKAYTILMMDLDNFKQINDTFGHAAGDLVLKTFARTTRECVRSSDIFGRYGGEEFLLILPGTHRQEAFFLAERIREAVGKVQIHPDQTQEKIGITVSIGQATFPEDARDPEGIIRAADAAMYKAKTGGKNQVVCAENASLPIRGKT